MDSNKNLILTSSKMLRDILYAKMNMSPKEWAIARSGLKLQDYAAGAIQELSRQLENARTEARKAKLRGRIQDWKIIIEKGAVV